MIVRGPVLIQHLIAWSNYEDDLRDYSIEIFDAGKDSEYDFYNEEKKPVVVVPKSKLSEAVVNNEIAIQEELPWNV